MRRLALAAALLASALPATASAMTKSDAVTLANAVNLQSADMRGYDVTPPDSGSGSDDASMDRCTGGVSSKKAVADIPSGNFDTGAGPTFREVSSDVQVMPTEALATKDFNAFRSKRSRRCILKQFKGKPIGGVGRVATVKVAVLRTGVAGAYGYRVTLHVRHGFGTIPLILEVFGIHEGPADVALSAISGAKGGLPRSQAGALLRLLQERLHAALNPQPPAV